jgi:hypothetical protein
MTAFWDIVLYSLVEVDLRFRGAYCLIALMMEVVRTSETSVCSNENTRRYIQEGSCLYIVISSLQTARTAVVSEKLPHYHGEIVIQGKKF